MYKGSFGHSARYEYLLLNCWICDFHIWNFKEVPVQSENDRSLHNNAPPAPLLLDQPRLRMTDDRRRWIDHFIFHRSSSSATYSTATRTMPAKNKQPSQPKLEKKVNAKWSLSETRLMLEHLAELQR